MGLEAGTELALLGKMTCMFQSGVIIIQTRGDNGPIKAYLFFIFVLFLWQYKKRKKETTLDSENNFILWCGYKFFLRTHRKIVKNESGMLSVPHPGSHSPLFPSFWWRRQAMAEAEKKGLTLQTLAPR